MGLKLISYKIKCCWISWEIKVKAPHFVRLSNRMSVEELLIHPSSIPHISLNSISIYTYNSWPTASDASVPDVFHGMLQRKYDNPEKITYTTFLTTQKIVVLRFWMRSRILIRGCVLVENARKQIFVVTMGNGSRELTSSLSPPPIAYQNQDFYSNFGNIPKSHRNLTKSSPKS